MASEELLRLFIEHKEKAETEAAALEAARPEPLPVTPASPDPADPAYCGWNHLAEGPSEVDPSWDECRAAAEKAAAEREPQQLVGRLVELVGLKARPDLNGRRGRVVEFKPQTGRLGVVLKTIGSFGRVERFTSLFL